MTDKGLLIVLSGPAGSGKGTVVKLLTTMDSNTICSISATTRAKRPTETDGVHYFFVEREEFERKIQNGEMLEYAEYIGNYYGTPRAFVEEMLQKGKNVILEIEVVGGLQIKQLFPQTVMIFFTPPGMTELEERLVERGTEDMQTIKKRIAKAATEIQSVDEYDYIVINQTGQAQAAANEIAAIITAEKCKRRKTNFIKKFLNKGE